MKPVDLNSLLQASASLESGVLDSYLEHYGIAMKSWELSDLNSLATALRVAGAKIGDLASFYVGYKVPQIGKEFDLLRFADSSILNIELKSESTPEKIRTQLRRNHYYLSFLGRPIEAFAFESSSTKMYRLSDDKKLEVSDAAALLAELTKQKLGKDTDPDKLFNPSDYLVSPFNSTNRFLADEYFLTHQQEDIKHKVLSSIAVASGATFIGITGTAGTGKTLLTFDIAKHLKNTGQRVLVIHCGLLNSGHHKLQKAGWRTAAIKHHQHYDLAEVDLLVVDEAQRIKNTQLEDLVTRVKAAKCACIFSFDKAQTLANWEESSDIAGKINSISAIVTYKLSEKIRTNKEIASFIKMLFNRKASAATSLGPNITLNYFDNSEDAKAYLASLAATDWEVLRFTPSQYYNEHHEKYFDALSQTSHQVIGQEFDQVAIAIDKFFSYDAAGALIYNGGAYYAPTKMLFQNITRARRRLNLVIIDNQEILKRCLAILNP
jgi:hypothetical protein